VGNLNFTYVVNGEQGKLVDFKRFISPVIAYLETMGIEAEQGPKNEILTRQKKISGNAEHVFKNRVLHHGTLLFHANLTLLHESLRVIPGRYRDKAVQSNRNSVINISECLDSPMDIGSFERMFLDYMLASSGGKMFELSEQDRASVAELAGTKFRSWEWIFGWSPDYELTSTFQYEDIICHIHSKVNRGILKQCRLESGQIPVGELDRLITLLKDCRHDADQIRTVIKAWNYPVVSQKNAVEELVYSFF
jgi:lipoate-protein ligase A